jgi:hypothetical protein
MESNPMGMIPKLLAKAVIRSQQMTLLTLARVVPAMMQKHQAVDTRNTAAQTAFFQKWPTLNAAQHGDTVKRFAVAYRQANPGATQQEAIDAVGVMVHHALGIAPSAPSAPRAPGASPLRAPPAAPFQPAATAAAAAIPQLAPDDNPWGFLAGGEEG